MTRRSLEQRAALVHEWQQSGLSANAFAKLHGFSPQNLPRWAADALAPPSAALTFVPLQPRSQDSLLLEIGSVRLRVAPGFDPDLLRAVVRALAPESAS